MVPWFRWLNYINPVGYAFEARALSFHLTQIVINISL
jgi:ABC-type multidrug transport system permease subunit